MLEYFSGNYVWNMAVVTLVEEIGTISEAETAFRSIAHLSKADGKTANAGWFTAMSELGGRLEAEAMADEARGCTLSASRKYHRSSMYLIRAERMVSHLDPLRLPTYQRAVDNYRKARALARDPIEFVDIPYKGGVMPALFLQGEGEGPRPTVIHLQGFDSLKETQFPYLDGYRTRGMSVLIVDQPGAGGALRLSGLIGEIETEHYVGTLVDYLQSRPDVDADRIGLAGISMGGYSAPRAAVYEPRIKACAAWGALYEAAPLFKGVLTHAKGAEESVPDSVGHALWTFGLSTVDELIDLFDRMSLEGVIQNLKCPLLVTHGENDRQVPLAQAQRMVAEAGSADKELKVFTVAEGGAEHCQLDNRYRGSDYVTDWFAERLGGSVSGLPQKKSQMTIPAAPSRLA